MQWHADFAGPYIRAAEESGRLQHMASETAFWAFLSQVAGLEKKRNIPLPYFQKTQSAWGEGGRLLVIVPANILGTCVTRILSHLGPCEGRDFIYVMGLLLYHIDT